MSVDQNAKHVRRLLVVLVGLLLVTLPAGGASAISTLPAYGSAIETLCDGDCAKRSNLETRRKAAGFGLPFELGLKILEDGLDLTIESKGNIFIYGSLNGSSNPFASITLEAVDLVIWGDVMISGGAFERPPIVPGGRTEPPLTCACLSIAGRSRVPGQIGLEPTLTAARIDLFTADLVIASVVGLEAPLAPRPGIAISRAGDIYLDFSMVEIGRLTATAGKTMYIVGSDTLPIPEPGTGLLLGLGLISLAPRRARASTSTAPLVAL